MISEVLGIDSDYIIIVLAVIMLLMLVLVIINTVIIFKLKKKYQVFMRGKSAKNLEKTLIERLEQVDLLTAANTENEKNIKKIFDTLQFTVQKVGLVKYDALEQRGGKLSFSLAVLDEKNDGFVMSAIHSKEGCYTYMKEIIAGNSITVLSEEEKNALERAKENRTIPT
jgi:hypothetical protein